jgi:transcriptional regulator GlxA family with amidase domain
MQMSATLQTACDTRHRTGPTETDRGAEFDPENGTLAPKRFAVLIFPSFPLMAFSAVVEPLRAANTIASRQLYTWSIVGPDEGVVVASNGIAVTPNFSAGNAPTTDYIVVCSGGDADRLTAKKPLSWIRRNLRLGAHIGSVADGAFYLARAGLLDNYECTLHWQSQPAFIEAFPHIRLVRQIFVIDRNRFTSAGGIGALDMMLDIIGSHYGDALSRGVAEWFVHDRIRAVADREQLQLRLRTGIRDDRVLNAVALMERVYEKYEDVSSIAGRLRLSMSQLERAFKMELGQAPAEYYRRIRMKRARDLLAHSEMSVREVGLACGYASFSSFVRAYRTVHGMTPGKTRRR